jgi:TDG/mug DNA glycosylase family protein
MNGAPATVGYEPDVLAEGLDVVFCGLNPASSAVADGHNFSNRSNRFWSVLNRSGFTDVRLRPDEDRRLIEYGCGITAIVRRSTRRAKEIAAPEFRQARPAFEAKMKYYAPRSIAFLGKRGFANMIGQQNVPWGRYSEQFAGAMIWILPNPSGLNRNFALDDLVTAYAKLRKALNQLPTNRRSRSSSSDP